jgi:hypothetical protein
VGLKILVILAYLSIFLFLIPQGWHQLWFALGAISGAGFLLLDERLFVRWYRERPTDHFLVTRSPLFLLSLLPLAVFVMTSSGSFWASGMMGSLVLWLLLEMSALRSDPTAFDRRFLQGISGQVSSPVVSIILSVGWAFFVLINLLMIY